uniref:Uncharacterized protein n=1 Tax=Monopterus albus TaxID=43700 RepID=A0A3Q3Q7Q4_MONAL
SHRLPPESQRLLKVPTLMKATADDENPCPGYLFQEIGKISHESSGCGQCLLEYLLERLQVESCHVKLKVLKIFVHLCGHGSNDFLTELRRNSTFIQQASVYSGPPDPIHGTALYQKVRNTAQVRHRLLLFTDTISTRSGISPLTDPPPTMGETTHESNRSSVHISVSLYMYPFHPAGSDSLLDKIQKAAEVVVSAVLPPTEHQGIRLHDNHYRAVVAPSAPIEVAVPACAYSLPAHRPKAVTQWCPGQVGGGWEEMDSGNSSSHNSSQDIAANSRISVGSKSAGTGSHSGASKESSGDLAERVEALQLGDCGQEMALISRVIEGSRVFLSREESQHFIKECSILNCEVVVELLSSKLQDPSSTRALCAVACLMTSDLLSLEQMFGAMQRRLHQLSEGHPGPEANKATKPNNSPSNIAQPSNYPASTCGSSGQLMNDNGEEEENLSPIQHEPVRTAEVNLAAGEPELLRDRSPTPPCEPLSRPSLFSGMELVTKWRPLCERETSLTETDTVDGDLKENPAVHNSNSPVNSSPLCISKTCDGAPSVCNSITSESSQPVSAFSFLNF